MDGLIKTTSQPIDEAKTFLLVQDEYKRPFDLAILVLSHLLLLPVWAVLWLVIPVAIRLDSKGPVFFSSQAAGKNGQVFRKFKFRTMIWNTTQPGQTYTLSDDPRVTWVGKFLRSTALDELPQLINILKGEMSFVGPRAYSVTTHALRKSEVSGWNLRLSAKPGLTSAGRFFGDPNNEAYQLKKDLEYIEHCNAFQDLKLLFRSLLRAFVADWDRKHQS